MDTEVMTPTVVDGSRQLAIEIKAQRELAIAAPRNEKRVFESALAELEFAPEFAEDAYYSIAYGNSRGSEEKSLVEGLSVVASRAIARRWGNCATKWRIGAETEEAFEVEGVFVDFETNSFFYATVRVPKTYIPKGTKIPVPLRADRLNLAIQAGGSKAERNATLKGLPGYFKDRYFATAKKIVAAQSKKDGKTEAERLDACYKGFAKFGVEQDRVKAYVEANLKGQSTDEIIATMRGVFNAIKDGQSKVEEVFEAPKASATGAQGAIKAGDIPGADL